MTFTPLKGITTGLVAVGLAGVAGSVLFAHPGPTTTTIAQQANGRSVPFLLAPSISTIDQLSASELEARLQFAEERMRLMLKMHDSGDASAIEAATARGEVAVLRSLVDAQSERLQDAIQLLRIERDVRHAELLQAQANMTSLTILKDSAERLRQSGAVSAGEVTIAEAKLAASRGDVQAKRARIRDTDARIEQAARRLEQIEALQVQEPISEPNSAAPVPKSELGSDPVPSVAPAVR